jgi:hypothetical protein
MGPWLQNQDWSGLLWLAVVLAAIILAGILASSFGSHLKR